MNRKLVFLSISCIFSIFLINFGFCNPIEEHAIINNSEFHNNNTDDSLKINLRNFLNENVTENVLNSTKDNSDKRENVSMSLHSIKKNEKLKLEDKPKIDSSKFKWVSELFEEAKRNFDLDSSVSPKCLWDYQMYKLHLQNQSLWAVKMLESSDWPLGGLLTGSTYHLGSFDECLQATEHSVRGQYCLAEATYHVKGNPNWKANFEITTDLPDSKASVWDALSIYRVDPVRSDRTKVGWAICLPDSCTTKDLEMSLNRVLVPLFDKHQLNIQINVDPKHCSTVRTEPPPQTYYTVKWILLSIFAIAMLATLYDWIRIFRTEDGKKKEKESFAIRLFTSFSAIRNIKKLSKIDQNGDISAIHFIKVLNILIIVYGHRFIYAVGYPMSYTDNVEAQYKSFTSIELVHSNVVDVFFMVSGFLTYYFGFRPMKKAGEIYYPLSVLLRWLRMVPVFCVLMLFIIFILPYIGDGPLWNDRVLREAHNCGTTWWANLLAINNFVSVDQQCLLVSWYISTDIQLCIIGGFLLYLITKNRTLGFIATGFVFLLCSAITFFVALNNGYDGVLKLYISLLSEPRNSEQFTKFYIATYARVGPYLTGFVASAIVFNLLKRGFKLSRKQIMMVSLLALLFGDGTQYYGTLLYAFGREYNPIENALYAALNRVLFAGGYATFVILYMTTGLGGLDKLMRLPIFVPLSRLTYSVFLVNTVIQLFHAASQRNPFSAFGRMQLVWLVLADITMSYIFGLFLHLYAEAPITNITKMLQRKLTKVTVKKVAPDMLVNGSLKDKPENPNPTRSSRSSSIASDIKEGVSKMRIPNGYPNESYVNTEIDHCRL